MQVPKTHVRFSHVFLSKLNPKFYKSKRKLRKFSISNISKSNRTILMKIHLHNIYITHKIVCKSGADSSSRSLEITI